MTYDKDNEGSELKKASSSRSFIVALKSLQKMLLLLLLVMMISLLQLQGPRYPPDLLLSLSTSVGQCQKMLNFPGCCTDRGGRKLWY